LRIVTVPVTLRTVMPMPDGLLTPAPRTVTFSMTTELPPSLTIGLLAGRDRNAGVVGTGVGVGVGVGAGTGAGSGSTMIVSPARTW
jgi:hypothetical protein